MGRCRGGLCLKAKIIHCTNVGKEAGLGSEWARADRAKIIDWTDVEAGGGGGGIA